MSTGRFFHVPPEVAVTPAEGHAYVKRWWTVHPEHGLLFWYDRGAFRHLEPGERAEPVPQCNSDHRTAALLADRHHPDCIVEFVAVVFAERGRLAMLAHLAANPWENAP